MILRRICQLPARVRALVGAALVVVVCASPASAQVFSPGALSRPHKDVDGIANCTKCHVVAGQHDNTRCIACHAEIGTRQSRGVGYHARVKKETCADCHKEHKGVAAAIIDWGGGERLFNHNLSGWPLDGAHKKQDCKKCHEARRIEDRDIQTLTKKTERKTFLGLSEECVSCHFDEHRGQEGASCDKCHTSTDFKKAPKFSHKTMAKFPLTGEHKKLACAKCHAEVNDNDTASDAFPKPRAKTYMQMTDIAHGNCTACHDDVHHGDFGKNCTSCHVTDGWKVIKQTAEDFGFHDKTDFPLRGEHTAVACRSCHGPFRGEAAKFKGVKHKSCADCHTDAHVGQLKKAEDGLVHCERCHVVNSFASVVFDVAMHKETRFALETGHQAVACNACHKDDAKLLKKVPATVKKAMDHMGRRVIASAARLLLPEVTGRCEECHADVHAGQFNAASRSSGPVAAIAADIAKRGCAACHAADAFVPAVFDHSASVFALTGKHHDVACAKCHAVDSADTKNKDVIVYRPLSTQCATCHTDAHAGQLAVDGATDCLRCHDTTGFKPNTKFDHNDAKFARFKLEGAHSEVKCVACHTVVEIDGVKVARYKPVSTTCAVCHQDEHRGTFDEFTP